MRFGGFGEFSGKMWDDFGSCVLHVREFVEAVLGTLLGGCWNVVSGRNVSRPIKAMSRTLKRSHKQVVPVVASIFWFSGHNSPP